MGESPQAHHQYGSQVQAGGGSSHLGNDVMNYALNAVDKVAGSDARRHIEKGVDSISKSAFLATIIIIFFFFLCFSRR